MDNSLENIKISIIIPMYNVECYIRQCLESILQQSLKDIEVIAIDDGSTDMTGEIVQEFARKDSRIRYYWQENQGQSVARNIGLDKAKGKYIGFVDSDDYIEKDSLVYLYRLCEDNSLDYIKTGWVTEDENGKIIGECRPSHMKNVNKVIFSREYFVDAVEHWYQVVPVNGIMRRGFLLNFNIIFPEGIQFEDNTYSMELYLKNPNAKAMQVDYVYYHARIRGGSTTTGVVRPKKIYDMLDNIRLMNDFISNYDSLKDVRALNKPISLLTFHMTNYYYRLDKMDRKSVDKRIKETNLSNAVRYPINDFQRYKVLAFLYFRPILGLYEIAKRSVRWGKRNDGKHRKIFNCDRKRR